MPFARYLGLFGDHVVPAVLYRYTQVLRREDLVNSKGKPLLTNARLEAVWKRLSDRFATVVADTSMITMTPEYAAHFHDIYIDGKEGAKMTGDRMKMLLLTLPFIVCDLIAPEVHHVHGLPRPPPRIARRRSHRPPPKRRAEGTPSPATWWSARGRARSLPGPLPGPPGPGAFAFRDWPLWQADGWGGSGSKGLWSAQWLCPCADPRAILCRTVLRTARAHYPRGTSRV